MRRVFRQRWTMVMNACCCYSSSYALAFGALEIGPVVERAAEHSRRFGKHMHMLQLFSQKVIILLFSNVCIASLKAEARKAQLPYHIQDIYFREFMSRKNQSC